MAGDAGEIPGGIVADATGVDQQENRQHRQGGRFPVKQGAVVEKRDADGNGQQYAGTDKDRQQQAFSSIVHAPPAFPRWGSQQGYPGGNFRRGLPVQISMMMGRIMGLLLVFWNSIRDSSSRTRVFMVVQS